MRGMQERDDCHFSHRMTLTEHAEVDAVGAAGLDTLHQITRRMPKMQAHLPR
jgi:hypothetical protein